MAQTWPPVLPRVIFASYCNVSAGNAPSPAGPRISSFLLPPLPYPAYLSIVCWNGDRQSVSERREHRCDPVLGQGQFKLKITAPFGPGSIRLAEHRGRRLERLLDRRHPHTGRIPERLAVRPRRRAPELLGEVASGVPFSGTLDGAGGSIFTIPASVPPGLSLYAVSIHFDDAPSGGEFLGASAPEFFLTP